MTDTTGWSLWIEWSHPPDAYDLDSLAGEAPHHAALTTGDNGFLEVRATVDAPDLVTALTTAVHDIGAAIARHGPASTPNAAGITTEAQFDKDHGFV
jgi:hypothetical protein